MLVSTLDNQHEVMVSLLLILDMYFYYVQVDGRCHRVGALVVVDL